MKTRNEIADELLNGCPGESLADHTIIADAIRSDKSIDEILNMSETCRWPDTYSWISSELSDRFDE
jgi:hypothetical protein